MTPISRKSVFAFAPLGLLALACSGTDVAGNPEISVSESSAIVAKCAPNQHSDCEPDGPRGQMICTCVNDPPPPVDAGPPIDAGPPSVVALPAPQRISMAWSSSYSTESVFEPFAWGNNDGGQLGNGTSGTSNPNPAEVHGLPIGFPTMIAATGATACTALGSSVWCWGAGYLGATGAGSGAPNQPTAARVPFNFGTISQLVAGGQHVCALSSGNVICWGDESNGYASNVKTPTLVFSGAAQIAAGNRHTCALRASDGAVFCWGINAGQLGTVNASSTAPNLVLGVIGRNIYAGGDSTCVQLASDGTFKCWGADDYGQLGDGATTNVTLPKAVPALTGATWLALGASHSCGIFGTALFDKQVRCWGMNTFGQLGFGTYDNAVHPTPVTVPGVEAVQVAVSPSNATCVHRNDGSTWCWGNNQYGQAGATGFETPVTSPHQVVQAF